MNIVSHEMTTMSSREIAELTGKRHDNVMRDIRNMMSDLGVLKSEDTYSHPSNGQEYSMFNLNKEETLCLVAGYHAKLRMAIIKRWAELEESVKQPALPDDCVSIKKDDLIWLQGEVIERMKNQLKAERKLKDGYNAKLDKPKQEESDKPDKQLLDAIVRYVQCNGRMPKADIVNDRKNYRFDGRKIPLKDDASKAVDYLVETGRLVKSERNTLDTPRINGGDVF
ncbi:MAG: Rha family transcriptional regulator [Shewanella sp.]